MNILVPLLNFDRTGGYRVLSKLANHWIMDGHVVTFLADDRSPSPFFPTSANVLYYRQDGKLLLSKSGAGYANNGNLVSGIIRLSLAIRRFNHPIDVILATHSLTALPIAFNAPKKALRLYYVQAYEPEYYAANPGLKNAMVAQLSRFSYILPLTQVANAPIYVGHSKIRAKHWIPPGIDPIVFYPRTTLPLFNQGPVVGIIGRKELGKGTIYALQAFEKLAERHPTIRLRVAFGNLPEGWQHQRAEIVHPRNDVELADFYRNIDIMIAPGIVQLGACHYPVIEAMAVGTPVITTDYLPANENNAWCVPIKDSDAIVYAVEKIMATDPENLQRKVRQAIADTQQFTWEKVSGNFLKLMGQIHPGVSYKK